MSHARRWIQCNTEVRFKGIWQGTQTDIVKLVRDLETGTLFPISEPLMMQKWHVWDAPPNKIVFALVDGDTVTDAAQADAAYMRIARELLHPPEVLVYWFNPLTRRYEHAIADGIDEGAAVAHEQRAHIMHNGGQRAGRFKIVYADYDGLKAGHYGG